MAMTPSTVAIEGCRKTYGTLQVTGWMLLPLSTVPVNVFDGVECRSAVALFAVRRISRRQVPAGVTSKMAEAPR